MSAIGFRRKTTHILTEAQNALNVAFGAILSAYIGNSLAEIDNRTFDQVTLAKFFMLLAVFILGLCVGNALLLRGEYKLAALLLAIGAVAAVFAHAEGRLLGFEVIVLRILAMTWIIGLLGSNLILTLFLYLHHRRTK